MTISKKTAIIFISTFILLLVLVSVMTMRFIVMGKTDTNVAANALDPRIAVIMTEQEKVYVLHEMRGLLEGVQEIIAAIRTNDMNKISTVARSLGRNVADDAPAGLMGKLPLDFKTLGLGTHASFDQISVTARDPEKMDLVLLQLSNVMTNCVACHSTYQIKTDKELAMTSLKMKESKNDKTLLSFIMDPYDSWKWQKQHAQTLVQHISHSQLAVGDL